MTDLLFQVVDSLDPLSPPQRPEPGSSLASGALATSGTLATCKGQKDNSGGLWYWDDCQSPYWVPRYILSWTVSHLKLCGPGAVHSVRLHCRKWIFSLQEWQLIFSMCDSWNFRPSMLRRAVDYEVHTSPPHWPPRRTCHIIPNHPLKEKLLRSKQSSRHRSRCPLDHRRG